MMFLFEMLKAAIDWFLESPYAVIIVGVLVLALGVVIVYCFVKDYVGRRGYELKIGYNSRKEKKCKK